MRLIDGDAFAEDVDQITEGGYLSPHDLISLINARPTIEERKTGKWIIEPHEVNGMYTHRCSECFSVLMIAPTDRPRYNYCPNCGSYNGGD